MSEPAFILVVALLTFAVVIAIPAVAVWRENSALTMARKEFALWVALVVGLSIAASALEAMVQNPAIDIAAAVGMLCIGYIFYQRLVRRARHAGMGKRIAYVGVIPPANFFVVLFLLFKRGAGPADPAPAAGG